FLATFLETHAMEGFAGGTVAGDFGEYLCAPGLRTLVIFEYEHPGTFGDNEAVAVRREGTRRAFGGVIPTRRHDAHEREALHDAGRDGGINATGEHSGDASVAYLVEGVAERVGGRSAARGDDVTLS